MRRPLWPLSRHVSRSRGKKGRKQIKKAVKHLPGGKHLARAVTGFAPAVKDVAHKMPGLNHALYAHRLALGRGEQRRRFFPRHRRRRASLRRRGELIADLAPGSNKISACRRGLPSPRHLERPGRCHALHAAPLMVLPSGDEAAALAPLADRSIAAVAGNLHGTAPARLQSRRRAPRQAARAVCRAFSGRVAQAYRPGARPPRRAARSRSWRRRSITACVICSSRSSPRKRSSRSRSRLMQTLGTGARARRRRRARLAALALPRRRRRRDDRHRRSPAEPRCGAHRAR